jgi:hypothetical protein
LAITTAKPDDADATIAALHESSTLSPSIHAALDDPTVAWLARTLANGFMVAVAVDGEDTRRVVKFSYERPADPLRQSLLRSLVRRTGWRPEVVPFFLAGSAPLAATTSRSRPPPSRR